MRFFWFFVLSTYLMTTNLCAMQLRSKKNRANPPVQEETSYIEEKPSFCCSQRKYPVEVRLGYYYFFGSGLRSVYGSGGLDLQFAAAFPVYNFCKGELSIYGAGEGVYAKGRSLAAHEKTTLWLFPFSLGLKYSLNVSRLCDWYVTAGPRYVFLWQHNHTAFIDKNIWASNIGFFGGTGCFVQLPKAWFLDFYVEGSYCRVKPSDHRTGVFTVSTQVGGLALGIGAGRFF